MLVGCKMEEERSEQVSGKEIEEIIVFGSRRARAITGKYKCGEVVAMETRAETTILLLHVAMTLVEKANW